MNWLLLSAVILAVGYGAAIWLLRCCPMVGWILLSLMAAVTILLVAGTTVCWDLPDNIHQEADYGLLLGCSLEDGRETPELVRRCGTALIWLENNPEGVLIVSGGDPGKQGITEAEVMLRWLTDHGADMTRIVPEEQAADTRQNLHYSKALAESMGLRTDTVAVITSEYHQTRARFLAEHQGQATVAVSCRTPWWDHLQAAVREVYSFVKAIAETL